ncbi:MAG: hypothetical protein LBD75_03530 [Candidatus Peribacteria bacterium]|nr:hypothetical protein [Candidatus Peribacteria bacterium]
MQSLEKVKKFQWKKPDFLEKEKWEFLWFEEVMTFTLLLMVVREFH